MLQQLSDHSLSRTTKLHYQRKLETLNQLQRHDQKQKVLAFLKKVLEDDTAGIHNSFSLTTLINRQQFVTCPVTRS